MFAHIASSENLLKLSPGAGEYNNNVGNECKFFVQCLCNLLIGFSSIRACSSVSACGLYL